MIFKMIPKTTLRKTIHLITSSRNSNASLIISNVILLFLLISTILFPYPIIKSETLHGTTILNWPYVSQRLNGQFEGFCIDLLNELAPLMGVAYTLSVVPDGQYGGWISNNGSINGMIGQVMRGEADFAIGDLTVLTNRARFVDFTISFLDYGLAALVRRDVLNRAGDHVRTFKDLSEQTAIRYGVKKHGANLPLFHDSPVVAKMYSFMDTHPSVFVESEREGLHRVKTERYAFITKSPFVEYVVQRDCDLVAIDDRRRNFQFEYAIAVPKGSPLKNRFSKAIQQLLSEGKLRELKDKYWLNPQRNCPGDPNFNPKEGKSVSEIKFAEGDESRLKPSIQVDQSSSDSNRLRSNNQLRQSDGRIKPHDRVDDGDVELIRPRPDRTRPRRPINRPRNRINRAFVQSYPMIIIIMILWTIIFSNIVKLMTIY